jgi:hypothetical protein
MRGRGSCARRARLHLLRGACEAAASALGVQSSGSHIERVPALAAPSFLFVQVCFTLSARIHPGADLLVLRKLPWQIKRKRIQQGAGSLLNRGSL